MFQMSAKLINSEYTQRMVVGFWSRQVRLTGTQLLDGMCAVPKWSSPFAPQLPAPHLTSGCLRVCPHLGHNGLGT